MWGQSARADQGPNAGRCYTTWNHGGDTQHPLRGNIHWCRIPARSKQSCQVQVQHDGIDKVQVFQMLVLLRPTATDLDQLPSWFLCLRAPGFEAPIAQLFNLSLSTSVVPRQWKLAIICPLPMITQAAAPSHYRLISITSVCREPWTGI